MGPEQGDPDPSSPYLRGPVAVFYIAARESLTRVGIAEQGLNLGQELWFQYQVQCQVQYQSQWDWVSVSGNSDPRLLFQGLLGLFGVLGLRLCGLLS